MMILVNGCTKTVLEVASLYPGKVGFLTSPDAGNRISKIEASGLPWAADNGAFSGFKPGKFIRMLDCIRGRAHCLWVACPDAVGDAQATFSRFCSWQYRILDACSGVAYVAQDGCEDMEIPWHYLTCLFIGGTTTWKLSASAESVAREAKRRGKLLHMGRVNSMRRLKIAFEWGCDSVDGTGMSRFGKAYIQRYVELIRSMEG